MKDIILIGAGGRGDKYATVGKEMEDGFRVVAVAEPIMERRNKIKKMHNIPDDMCFESWEDIFEKEKFADVVIIATMDKDHFAPSMAAIEKGYNIMLEKPMAPNPEECILIEKAAKEKGVFVLVCFVLRYSSFFTGLKKLIKSGIIGDVINIQHAEDVGNIHQSHSFVRGNWGNSEKSSFMLLQKSSHDTDILQWLLDKKCTRVSSFGSTSFFKRENAPEGSPEYCINGCPYSDECFYDARKIYMETKDEAHRIWFRTAATKKAEPTDEDVEWALRNTQYGKCVFKCDNDVVDHQIVNFEFEGGVTANFTMSAFNEGTRRITIMGTKGTITGDMNENSVIIYSFSDKSKNKMEITSCLSASDLTGGHGGGDEGIMHELKALLDAPKLQTGVSQNSVSGHMVAFAAEHSRITGQVVYVNEYIDGIKNLVDKSEFRV